MHAAIYAALCLLVLVAVQLQEFLDPERAAALVAEQQYSHVIDCIDSVAPKVALLLAGHAAGVNTISSMGAGKGWAHVPGPAKIGPQSALAG